jgi:nucleotide-binding universal stress UspA family protein
LITPERSLHIPRILVGLDGSPLAETILEPAAQLAAALASPAHGALHITRTVQSVQITNEQVRPLVEQRNKEAIAEAQVYLDTTKQRFTTGDLAAYQLAITSSVISHTDASDIWKRIIEESRCIGDVPGYSGCDIIALATHGRQGFQHFLFGSITEQVYNETRMPLLIVHPQDAPVEEPVHT